MSGSFLHFIKSSDKSISVQLVYQHKLYSLNNKRRVRIGSALTSNIRIRDYNRIDDIHVEIIQKSCENSIQTQMEQCRADLESRSCFVLKIISTKLPTYFNSALCIPGQEFILRNNDFFTLGPLSNNCIDNNNKNNYQYRMPSPYTATPVVQQHDFVFNIIQPKEQKKSLKNKKITLSKDIRSGWMARSRDNLRIVTMEKILSTKKICKKKQYIEQEHQLKSNLTMRKLLDEFEKISQYEQQQEKIEPNDSQVQDLGNKNEYNSDGDNGVDDNDTNALSTKIKTFSFNASNKVDNKEIIHNAKDMDSIITKFKLSNVCLPQTTTALIRQQLDMVQQSENSINQFNNKSNNVAQSDHYKFEDYNYDNEMLPSKISNVIVDNNPQHQSLSILPENYQLTPKILLKNYDCQTPSIKSICQSPLLNINFNIVSNSKLSSVSSSMEQNCVSLSTGQNFFQKINIVNNIREDFSSTKFNFPKVITIQV